MVEDVFKLANEGKLKDAASLIRKLIISKQDLKGTHISLAHILFLSCDWECLNLLLPKDTNTYLSSGYLNSIAKGRPVNENNEPIPWFTYPAIDFLSSIIQGDWSVFEWGSGNSTLWWASHAESVVAVEDNEPWYREVVNQMPGNASVLFKEGEEYSSAILDFEKKSFDAIIVDGSLRNECLKNAIRFLSDKGILIFDNSDKKEFSESAILLNEHDFYRLDFWGLIPSYLYKNCTSIYFKDPSFLKNRRPPFDHGSPVGFSCEQAMSRLK